MTKPNVPALTVIALATLFRIPPALPGVQAGSQPASERTYSVRRLQPKAFPELPKILVTELEGRGCTIPQPYTDRKANVIRGEFAKPGQTDWAVLCSTKGSTSLLVFFKAETKDPAVLASIPDNPRRIFDWFIRPVARKFMMDRYRAYDGPKPPPIDHQGIESGGETASSVWYYYRGRWLSLQGAD